MRFSILLLIPYLHIYSLPNARFLLIKIEEKSGRYFAGNEQFGFRKLKHRNKASAASSAVATSGGSTPSTGVSGKRKSFAGSNWKWKLKMERDENRETCNGETCLPPNICIDQKCQSK